MSLHLKTNSLLVMCPVLMNRKFIFHLSPILEKNQNSLVQSKGARQQAVRSYPFTICKQKKKMLERKLNQFFPESSFLSGKSPAQRKDR